MEGDYEVTGSELMNDTADAQDTQQPTAETETKSTDAASTETNEQTEQPAQTGTDEEKQTDEKALNEPKAKPEAEEDAAAEKTPGGPNAEYAARRAQREAQRALREQMKQEAFKSATAGLKNPATNQPFTSVEEFETYKMNVKLNAMASQAGVKPEDISEIVEQVRREAQEQALSQFKESEEYQDLLERNAALQQQSIEAQFNRDLDEIRKNFPDEKAKSVTELGNDFMKLRAQGISLMAAYAAVRKVKSTENASKNPTTGDVKSVGQPKREWFTKAEVDAMSDDELDKNQTRIWESMKHW